MMWLNPIAIVCALMAATPIWADDLLVFAAASLKGPLDKSVAEMPEVQGSYAGSGTLARQVQQGAPADVVLLASDAWMGALVDSGVVDDPIDFAGNRLVLVGQSKMASVTLDAPSVLAALDGGRLAMGFTASVPAGIYGKEALVSLGLWADVAPHVAEVDNVRAALALVARGETPLGVVYATDVRVVPDLAVVAVFPDSSHDDVSYWAAKVSASDHPGAAGFVARMQSTEVQLILRGAGFCAIEAPCEAQ